MQKSASEILCSNLSQGLHAAAQPLTILRASLGNDHMDRMTREELAGLATRSAIEVERVCRLFSCLQQLVSIESIKPQLTETALLPLLAHAADGVKLLFEQDGMFLNSIVPDVCHPVLANRARTLQALSNVLLIAHTVSRTQDTVELIVSSSHPNAVRVVVKNTRSYVDEMNAEQRLNMSLADANMRSQQAGFSCSLNPFSVEIEFSGVPSADTF
jgi:signal transduction histidine kinase